MEYLFVCSTIDIQMKNHLHCYRYQRMKLETQNCFQFFNLIVCGSMRMRMRMRSICCVPIGREYFHAHAHAHAQHMLRSYWS